MPPLTLNPDQCKNFSDKLQKLYQSINDRAPLRETGRPIIGISTHWIEQGSCVAFLYSQSVERAGGIPLLIPQTSSIERLQESLSAIDGLLLTGGGDVHPHFFDQEPHPQLGAVKEERDQYDLTLTALALQMNIPTLGICKGMQMINIALGGSLFQDLGSCYTSSSSALIGHNPPIDTQRVAHYVEILPDMQESIAAQILRKIDASGIVGVNSIHHQAVDRLGVGVQPVATSRDGIIEVVDLYPEKPVIGVQWHPERLAEHAPFFDHLIAEATLYRQAKEIHRQAPITLDSHTDTPMLFTDGPLDLSHRSHALVDFVKMAQGKMDAVFMAVYIPQGELSDKGYSQAYQMMKSKQEYIALLPKRYPDACQIVVSSNEILEGKKSGKALLIPALENAYPIGLDLSMVAKLKEQGIAYITLCHNGDNQFCDSARKSQKTHNGLSPLGKELIYEMQKLGIMIDISHASWESVQDVLQEVSVPIIASHSSCYSVCPHERNLSDELIKQIANRGGVIQVCLYAGFLAENPEEADLNCLMDHIDHLVQIVGTDHVGIGSDFDGDGSIVGCRGSNDLIRITVELLRRGYTKSDIEKIWGGNLLRVMKNVESYAYKQA